MDGIRIATITLKATDHRTVARFWRDLLGYTVAPNHSDSVLLAGAPDQPQLLIQPAGESPAPGAIHLDLCPDDHDAAVRRAVALGAVSADVGQTGDEGWTVLADPGGNLFCILDSAGEPGPGTPTPLD